MAGSSIKQFETYVKHFAMASHFDFTINDRAIIKRLGLPNPPSEAGSFYRFFGKAMSLPSIHGDIKPNFFFNVKYTTPTMIDVDNVNITFYDTKTAYFHRLFSTWLLNRYAPNGALKFYPDDYSCSINMKLHDKLIYTLEKSFPIAVSDFRLDNDSNDQFGTFDVTFFVSKLVPNKSLGFS